MYASVYFVEDPTTGLVKVGFSRDPKRVRLYNLRSELKNYTLRVIAVSEGDQTERWTLEKRVHALLSSTRDHGEWFSPSPALDRCIAACSKVIPTGAADADELAILTSLATQSERSVDDPRYSPPAYRHCHAPACRVDSRRRRLLGRMGGAPMTASPPVAARATSMLTNPAPDITYRGKDYRLSEPGRNQGASVRVADCPAVLCSCCRKPLPVAAKSVRLANRIVWLHIGCAIRSGDLVEQARLLAGRVS